MEIFQLIRLNYKMAAVSAGVLYYSIIVQCIMSCGLCISVSLITLYRQLTYYFSSYTFRNLTDTCALLGRCAHTVREVDQNRKNNLTNISFGGFKLCARPFKHNFIINTHKCSLIIGLKYFFRTFL